MEFGRKYKIIEEKTPSEKFTRWTPMYCLIHPKMEGGETNWNFVSIKEKYYKTEEEAKKAIDDFEEWMLQREGFYIIGEIEYKPKK